MKILILGAGGFIGSHLVEWLITRDEHEIVGVDVSDEKLAGISGRQFSFVHGDIREGSDRIEPLVRDSDVMVDLVAYANPSIYVESPLEVVDLNFFQNHRLIEMCVEHRTRVIQYSTSEVYGFPSGEVYEEETSRLVLGPVQKQRWIYACAKQLLDRIVHAYGLRGDLDYTIVRPFNFVGPRFDYLVPAGSTGGPRLFAHYMSALLTGGPMYLVDGGHRHRSFTHIEDANSAFQTLLDHPDAHNEIFNIGNPEINVTVREVAELMLQLYEELTGAPADCDLVEITGEEFYGSGYEDVDRVPPSIEKISRLGWHPVHGLEVTFRDAMCSYLAPGSE